MRRMIASSLVIIAAMGTASAEEKRDLSAHEHGVGKLNLAFEADQIAIELEAPGADIVGFEHKAESADDKAKIDAALAVLAKPTDLFVLPEGAACVVTNAKVELESEDDHDDHDHEAAKKDDDHDHETAKKDDDHDHETAKKDDDHDHEAAKKDDDHDHEGEKHADHDEEEGESHTEFHAEYMLKCEQPSAINRIEFPYFAKFPNARELEVQMISDKGTNGFEVKRGDPVLDLSGMI